MVSGENLGLEQDQTVYKTLLEDLPLVAWVSNYETSQVFYVNDEIERLLGYSPAEWTGDFALQEGSVLEADRPEYQAHIARTRAEGGSACEYRLSARDGSVVWVHERSVVVPGDADRPRRVKGFTLDVSSGKRAEEALRESEERYRLIVETTAEGVCVVDPDGRVAFANPRWCELAGRELQDVLGHHVWEFNVEGQRTATEENLERLETGMRTQFERRMLRPDGKEQPVLITTSPLVDGNGEFRGALGMVTDLTEHKQLEEQLARANQLDAIGGLAGGVAHDFNNSMMAIRGFAELLIKRLDEDSPSRRHAEGIKQAADGAAALTRQLLAFGRRQVLQPEVLDVNDAVRALEPALRGTIGEQVELELDLRHGLGAVSVDPGQLEQVILELADNARDAMPTGGRLTIRTSEASRPGEEAPFLLLEVADDGVGVPEELRERVLEPFFTTKELGGGTGMGLPTVYGIVNQSGGHFELESEPARGSTFKVYLPLVLEDQLHENAMTADPALAGKTVLLVEDDEIVRAVVREMLEQLGCRVLEAALPDEALELASEDGPIAVLLTDVVMPGMGGRELAERLCELRPELRVLYMSGYTAGAIGRDGSVDAETAFLPKPFTLELLKRKLVSLPRPALPPAQVGT